MTRRQSSLAIATAGAAVIFHSCVKASPMKAIQLHVDLEVDPARTTAIEEVFRNTFEPTIRRQPGFVAVALLRLRNEAPGAAAGKFNYRLLISFETEEQRKQWVATAEHQRVWPEMEKNLTGAKYNSVLYDVV